MKFTQAREAQEEIVPAGFIKVWIAKGMTYITKEGSVIANFGDRPIYIYVPKP